MVFGYFFSATSLPQRRSSLLFPFQYTAIRTTNWNPSGGRGSIGPTDLTKRLMQKQRKQFWDFNCYFCLKLKILATTEPIGFSFLEKLYIGIIMVLGYFVFRFKSWGGFKLYLMPLSVPLNIDTLDDRDVAASTSYYVIIHVEPTHQDLIMFLKF